MPFISINNYTTRARQVYFKHPLLSQVAVQVYFWIVAYLILAGILHFYALFINSISSEDIPYVPGPAFLGSFIVAVFYGITLGVADYYVFEKWNRKHPLVFLILLKGLFYLITMTILFTIMRYTFWEYFVLSELFDGIGPFLTRENWRYMYYIFVLYTLSMGLVISFIIQMNKRFGPGVLIPFLMGKYLNPLKEKRVFMFLDLDNSTHIAEELGHLKYSELIQDCFWEINKDTILYEAEIYQYVGDEMVLTWNDFGELDYNMCIDFYFATKRRIQAKKEYFIDKYGLVPHFKAGANIGWVTGVEVGSVKTELAFHGDAINVAARIEEKCNDLESEFLISEELKTKVKWPESYSLTAFDSIMLKGKKEALRLFKVEASKERVS